MCFSRQSNENETINQENKAETNMDMQPKTGAGGSRIVKTKGSFEKIGPRKQKKFKYSLENWLVKPSKSSSATEVCPDQEDVEMTEVEGFQNPSPVYVNHENAEKSSISATDEDTQILTPQDLSEDFPLLPDSKVTVSSEIKQKPAPSQDESEEQSVGACSSKQRTKITDFFSVGSSQGFTIKNGWRDASSEEKDANEKRKPADVKWLGTPINKLRRLPECGGKIPLLKDVPDQHTVMIRVWEHFPLVTNIKKQNSMSAVQFQCLNDFVQMI